MRGRNYKTLLSSSKIIKGARESRKRNLKGIGSQRRKREELAQIAAEEAKADKDTDLEEAKIAANERLEMARNEGIVEQDEGDRELKRT